MPTVKKELTAGSLSINSKWQFTTVIMSDNHSPSLCYANLTCRGRGNLDNYNQTCLQILAHTTILHFSLLLQFLLENTVVASSQQIERFFHWLLNATIFVRLHPFFLWVEIALFCVDSRRIQILTGDTAYWRACRWIGSLWNDLGLGLFTWLFYNLYTVYKISRVTHSSFWFTDSSA